MAQLWDLVHSGNSQVVEQSWGRARKAVEQVQLRAAASCEIGLCAKPPWNTFLCLFVLHEFNIWNFFLNFVL